jgi:hypothetical protein
LPAVNNEPNEKAEEDEFYQRVSAEEELGVEL